MYTSKELQIIANRQSIKANPYDYTFSNKIVLNDKISELTYPLGSLIELKQYVCNAIEDYFAQEKSYPSHLLTRTFDSAYGSFYISNLSVKDLTTSVSKEPNRNFSIRNISDAAVDNLPLKGSFKSLYDITPMTPSFSYLNNFKIDIDHYIHSKYTNIYNPDRLLSAPHIIQRANKDFKSKNELDNLFAFHLYEKNSISSQIPYIVLSQDLKYSYSELVNTKNIAKVFNDYLNDSENFGPLNLFLLTSNTYIVPTTILEVLPESLIKHYYGIDKDSVYAYRFYRILEQNTRDNNVNNYLHNNIVMASLYYIEMLNIIFTQLDEKDKQYYLDMLRVNNNIDNFYAKNIYDPFTMELNPMVEEVVMTKENDMRFEKMHNLIYHSDFTKVLNDTFKDLKNIKNYYDSLATYDSIETAEDAANKGYLTIFEKFLNDYGLPTLVAKHVRAMHTKAVYQDLTNFNIYALDFAKKHKVPLSSHVQGMVSDVFGDNSSKDDFSNPFLELDYPEEDIEMPEKQDKPDVNLPKLSDNLDDIISSFKEKDHTFTVKPVTNSPEYKDKYAAIAAKLKLLNSLLVRQIRDIKTYNQGAKLSNLSSGKIDAKNLWKYDTSDNLFYNNKYEIKELDLAFGILLDASGSMSGEKIKDGIITMTLLHETLRSLNINHAIYDHTSKGHHNTVIRKYHDFKESKHYTISKAYNMMAIEAREGNNDAGALYYMEQALLKTKNKDKICIIFSDGQPTECSEKELKDQVKSMERKGIKVIGVGINLPEIAEYYKDYANGKNLNEMINIVTKILKQYVLDK